MRKAGVSEQEIKPIVEIACAGEPLQPNEIEDAVRNSRNLPPDGSRVRRWPAVSLADRQRVKLEKGGMAELTAVSPDDVMLCTPRRMLKRLFRPGEQVCAGTSPSNFITRERDAWLDKGLARECHIVPSPMTARQGTTRDGRKSGRTIDNVGRRRWIIIEQDYGSLHEQAAIVMHLADFASLGIVVFSGGKSLHAWFAVAGKPETDIRKFFAYAVTLGADTAMWCPAQMGRLPGARRAETGKLQRAVYVDFDVIKTAKWGKTL